MNELKPCPFCGEKPDDYIRNYMKNGGNLSIETYIICRKCESKDNIVKKSVVISSGVPYKRLIEAREKLIKDWNTRVGD